MTSLDVRTGSAPTHPFLPTWTHLPPPHLDLPIPTHLDSTWTHLTLHLDSTLPTLRLTYPPQLDPLTHLLELTYRLTHHSLREQTPQRLQQLEGSEVLVRAQDKANRSEYLRQLDDSCPAPATVRTKIGAQVPYIYCTYQHPHQPRFYFGPSPPTYQHTNTGFTGHSTVPNSS